jgi:hypothetical protein
MENAKRCCTGHQTPLVSAFHKVHLDNIKNVVHNLSFSPTIHICIAQCKKWHVLIILNERGKTAVTNTDHVGYIYIYIYIGLCYSSPRPPVQSTDRATQPSRTRPPVRPCPGDPEPRTTERALSQAPLDGAESHLPSPRAYGSHSKEWPTKSKNDRSL